jgi:hypothetical protein
MSALPEPNPQTELERLDAATNQAIAACGGDMRSAIRALILANEYLEYEVCELMKAVSRGYPRGELTPRRSGADWYD